ncbi:molybdopterin-dependent oxidoreductase [Nocardioides sp. GXQ0305]|uniref:molybdopterin-dependent oxidoreductase n=1 Tax=Nocardioides sp. GXQ0305 TaxID=3423912 RepID=UPI003D7E5F91
MSRFSSALHDPAVSARVGRWLGICFGTAFLTGVISHWAQLPVPPVPFPTSPSWGYRVTQGLHVVSGTAAVPLLLVKLWSVYPRLFRRPPREARALALEVVDRVSVGVLVASGIFLLVTGLANATQWYPWSFSFRPTHYAVAWVAIGALVAHLGIKAAAIRDGLAGTLDERGPVGLSRRGLLRAAYGASAVAVLGTAGGAVPWLRQVSVFGVTTGDGSQGLPVNRTAAEAGVDDGVTGADFRLTVVHGDRSVALSRDDLAAMPQHTEELPIACVEGWSASGRWTGVRMRDLLDLVDAPAGSDVAVSSLQTRYAFARSTLPGNFADDPRTLLALALSGEPLDLDHGYPCRVIAPNRPGVLQTKWVTSLEVAT